MKKYICRVFSLCTAFVLILGLMSIAIAHSGRTDSSGGHKDNKNKSGLGSYHYHCGGYPPHLHRNGVCPYRSATSTSSKNSSSKPTPKVTISNKPSSLYVGESVRLTCTSTPTSSTIKWSSSNENVAIVSSNGDVQAIGNGSTTIKATASNGASTSFKLTVKIREVGSVEIVADQTLLYVRDEIVLSTIILPVNATYPDVNWTSSDESVLTVSENGVLTAHECGTATITATSKNGVYDAIEIEVQEIIAESIEIKTDGDVQIGRPEQLEVMFHPEDTTIKDIVWSVSNEHILTVDTNGIAHAHDVGTVIVTATQKDTFAQIQVQAKPVPAESVEIKATLPEKIVIGDEGHFSAKIFPEDATYKEVTWASSNRRIASIDEHGKIVTHFFGSAVITATTVDGVCATYDLQVHMPESVVALLLGLGAILATTGVLLLYKKRKSENNS